MGDTTGRTPTSRTLLLARHAEAEHSRRGLDDHDRDLTRAGEQEARELGRRLRDAAGSFHVLTSSARRARRTAELACGALEDDVVVEVVPRLYAATADDLLDVVRTCPHVAGTVLLVGHLPAVRDLARRFGEDPSTPWGTASVSSVQLDAPAWADVSPALAVRVSRR